MTDRLQLRTARTLLRPWRDEDEPAMQAINRDPQVTRYLNRPVDAATVAGFHAAVQAHWAAHGFGAWAVESREPGREGAFLGFVGIAFPAFLPAVAARPELGWRLAREHWGRGLATEAAHAARADAHERCGLDALISIIHPENRGSQRVAEKLGMTVERQVHNPVIDRLVDVWAQPLPAAQ
ncbi:GNAT family N-acetyltransferase [Patulibacter defluvii]|uniref:GNAT family N-acetyltransferase n=1 Tax=Patulibacter defluvii TaxID=3095358 RepID=UPI002A750132|nr:GNAT family N-acetyltransferase [Patulibacter sp. DM4]